MAVYSNNGKSHRILARLAHGPATLAELREATRTKGAVARKVFFLVGAMMRDGLIHREGSDYTITPDGLDALAELSAGHDFTVAEPTVRIFARAAA